MNRTYSDYMKKRPSQNFCSSPTNYVDDLCFLLYIIKLCIKLFVYPILSERISSMSSLTPFIMSMQVIIVSFLRFFYVFACT